MRAEPSTIAVPGLDGLRGNRVLVTGHTGFKGAWLSAALGLLGADVAGAALAPPALGAFHDLGLADEVDHHEVDIRDAAAVARVLDATRPRLVYHLAAQPLVRASWADPLTTFATNVVGTANVVDAALRCPDVEAVVVVTTDKVYENHGEGRPFVEDDRLGGHDPYSASKAAAELVLRPFRSAEHLGLAPRPVVSVRAGNVIGGGDWSDDRLVPDIVRACQAGTDVVLRRPDATRPWQHVLDCVSGYLMIGARALAGAVPSEAYNLAHAGGTRTVFELATAILDAWPDTATQVRVEREDDDAEAALLELDPARARDELGWHPAWDLDEAIVETVRYYRGAEDLSRLGRDQIERYLAATTGSS